MCYASFLIPIVCIMHLCVPNCVHYAFLCAYLWRVVRNACSGARAQARPQACACQAHAWARAQAYAQARAWACAQARAPEKASRTLMSLCANTNTNLYAGKLAAHGSVHLTKVVIQ